jgi:hypothetical protein
MGKKRKKKDKNLDDGQLLLTVTEKNRPDLSSERAPHRDKTASPTVGSIPRSTG